MKITKTQWLVIGVVVSAITILSLGLIYLKNSQQREQLNTKLAQTLANPAKIEVTRLLASRAELEAEVDEAKSRFESMRAVASRQAVSSVIIRTLFDVAKANGMEIVELSSAVPTVTSLKGVNFSLISLRVRAEGNTSRIVDFIGDLNASFDAGVIESVSVSVPKDPASSKTTVDIGMSIYSD